MKPFIEHAFDLAVHEMDDATRGTPFKLNDKVLTTDIQKAKVMNKLIQAFVFNKGESKKIQAFGISTDLVKPTEDVFDVFSNVTEFDTYWQAAFKTIRLGQYDMSWEINDVNSGLEFKLVPEGGKITYEGLSSSSQTVTALKYGAALGVTYETIAGRKLYKFLDQMEDARSKLFALWADIHYGLLATAGAANDVTWQGLATESQLRRDITTINYALHKIGEDNKDKGYGAPGQVPYKLYCDPSLEGRIEAAFRAQTAGLGNVNAEATAAATGSQIVKRRVDRFYSYDSNILANTALLVWPGQKVQNAEKFRSMNLERKDQESLMELKTYWTCFGAAIGDGDQVVEVNFA